MTTFTLDTSGAVEVAGRVLEGGLARHRAYRWPDLDPFTQGYVEALFSSLGPPFHKGAGTHTGERRCRFSDLSPSALAAILADCAERLRTLGINTQEEGALFWRLRQDGRAWRSHSGRFEPLTVSLTDDGKVHLSTIERVEGR